MFRGLEKNLFGPGCDYRWWRLVIADCRDRLLRRRAVAL